MPKLSSARVVGRPLCPRVSRRRPLLVRPVDDVALYVVVRHNSALTRLLVSYAGV